MKKLMILLIIIVVFVSCKWGEIPGGDAFPPGEDWVLDIVKFKKPEYKDYILTRCYPGVMGLDSYINDTPCYRLDDPSWSTYGNYGKSLSPLYEKGQWVELADGYYLCRWQWQSLFCSRGNIKSAQSARYSTYSHYGVYNISNKKEEVDNLFLMKDEWSSLPDTFPYTIYYRYYSKPYFDDDIRWGGWKKDTFKVDTLYLVDFLYSTTDVSQIMDDEPFAEHYVVTAKSLFLYTNTHYNKIEKVYLNYNPWSPCDGLTSKLPDDVSETSLYNWDTLSDRISLILKEVIESGKLQEYVDYDLNYNKNGSWWVM